MYFMQDYVLLYTASPRQVDKVSKSLLTREMYHTSQVRALASSMCPYVFVLE